MENIVEFWLRTLNLSHHYESFLDNGYDNLEICKKIRGDDLTALGIIDHNERSRLCMAVRELQEGGGTQVYIMAANSAFPTKPPSSPRNIPLSLLAKMIRLRIRNEGVHLADISPTKDNQMPLAIIHLAYRYSCLMRTPQEDVEAVLNEEWKRAWNDLKYNGIQSVGDCYADESESGSSLRLVSPYSISRTMASTHSGMHTMASTPLGMHTMATAPSIGMHTSTSMPQSLVGETIRLNTFRSPGSPTDLVRERSFPTTSSPLMSFSGARTSSRLMGHMRGGPSGSVSGAGHPMGARTTGRSNAVVRSKSSDCSLSSTSSTSSTSSDTASSPSIERSYENLLEVSNLFSALRMRNKMLNGRQRITPTNTNNTLFNNNNNNNSKHQQQVFSDEDSMFQKIDSRF